MELIYLTTVTPVYRGARTLRDLVVELAKVRAELEAGSSPLRLGEAIFVDDGSADDSADVLATLSQEHAWVQVISLSRNFGQHPATIAGILHSSGDWIATLDEDLQHHPRYILPLMKQAVAEGRDVMYAHPESSVHESAYRDFASRGYKQLIAWLSGNPNVTKFNSFRIMRGSQARAAAAVAGHQTYFDIALCWFTTRVGTRTLPLKDHRYIEQGRSGYSFRSLMSHARRLLSSSEVKILRLGAFMGLAAMVLAVLGALTAVVVRIVAPELIAVRGWTSAMVAILFFGGLNAFLAGMLLEHLSIVLMQTHGKPTFFKVNRGSDAALRAWFESHQPEGGDVLA